MKKNILLVSELLTILIMILLFTSGCTEFAKQAGEVAYNGAMVTSSSLRVYDTFDQINEIILKHVPEFSEADQITIRTVSVNFNMIKEDFDKLTSKSADIYKVTMNIDKNIGLFTTSEVQVLKAFNADAELLHAQVQIIKSRMLNVADKNNIDITNIVEKTYGIAKAFSTIAVML